MQQKRWKTDVLTCTGPKSLIFGIFKEKESTRYCQFIKSCWSLQNSNANVKRSHSDNNNTLRLERSSFSNESLMGLRQIKDYARKRTGAEDVDTIDKGITKEMLVANSNYINRKKEEAERLLGKSRKREVLKKKRGKKVKSSRTSRESQK